MSVFTFWWHNSHHTHAGADSRLKWSLTPHASYLCLLHPNIFFNNHPDYQWHVSDGQNLIIIILGADRHDKTGLLAVLLLYCCHFIVDADNPNGSFAVSCPDVAPSSSDRKRIDCCVQEESCFEMSITRNGSGKIKTAGSDLWINRKVAHVKYLRVSEDDFANGCLRKFSKVLPVSPW